MVTHAGADIGFPPPAHCTPERVLALLRAVRPDTLVLAHMGGWQMWDEAGEALAGTGVYVDTAFVLAPHAHRDGRPVDMLSPERFTALVRAFGADRVLFGTDSPWSDQCGTVRRIEACGLTEAERRAVFQDNAARLLGL